MNTASRGLYAGDGFVVSQFQPNYAQDVFPCFDDPRLKATFDINVTSDPGDVVITNGGTSARMPPHLVFIAAGKFRALRSERVTLYSLDEPEQYADAVDAANEALTFYESYLGVPYPREKLDLVVVPAFEADGMESSGAIVFRAAALRDPKRTETLVAHEVAHQWFGSLATPESWADLWLSEGFATWIAAKATHAERGLVRAIRAAMAADSGEAARPLRSSSANPKELFDSITYDKGAAVLRMLEAATGEEEFRREAAAYLQRDPAELRLPDWAAELVEVPGVPHVSIEWSGCTVRIERRWDRGHHSFPVFLRIDGKPVTCRDETEITMPQPIQWVFGNANASGYYRCSYRDFAAIPVAELSAVERIAFLADLYDAVWAAETDTLVLMRALEQTPDATMAEEMDELLTGRTKATAPPLSALTGSTGAEKIAACEALLRHPATRRDAWAYLKEHWTELRDELISFGGRGAVPALAAACDPALRNDIAAFFAEHPPRGAERALQQTIEQIDARIRFREREGRKYTCRSIWIGAGRPAATPQLRVAYSILSGLGAALYGALHMRLAFDQFRLDAPPWMHSAAELRQAHAGVEQLFLRLFRGEAIMNDGVVQLIQRAQEDLSATAATAETSESPVVAAILASREATARDYFLGGLIAFTDLFDGPEHANRWRVKMPAMEVDLARARTNLGRILRGDSVSDAPETAVLARVFRSQAADLSAALTAVTGR